MPSCWFFSGWGRFSGRRLQRQYSPVLRLAHNLRLQSKEFWQNEPTAEISMFPNTCPGAPVQGAIMPFLSTLPLGWWQQSSAKPAAAAHSISCSNLSEFRSSVQSAPCSSMAALVQQPCFSALRLPGGAPDRCVPPYVRQLLLTRIANATGF